MNNNHQTVTAVVPFTYTPCANGHLLVRIAMIAEVRSNRDQPDDYSVITLSALGTQVDATGVAQRSWTDITVDHPWWQIAVQDLDRTCRDVVLDHIRRAIPGQCPENDIVALCAAVGPTAARAIEASRRRVAAGGAR